MSARIWKSAKAWGTPDLLHKCAHQKLLESPFDEHEVADLRKDITTILEQGVWYWNGRRATDGTSRSTGGFFGLVLAASEDVDAEGIGLYASGVAIGVGVKLPRISPFYKKKRKWWPPSQRRPQEQLKAAMVEDFFRDNYRSAFDLEDAVKAMLKNQIAKKQAFNTSLDAARRKLGKGITVASLGGGEERHQGRWDPGREGGL